MLDNSKGQYNDLNNPSLSMEERLEIYLDFPFSIEEIDGYDIKLVKQLNLYELIKAPFYQEECFIIWKVERIIKNSLNQKIICDLIEHELRMLLIRSEELYRLVFKSNFEQIMRRILELRYFNQSF